MTRFDWESSTTEILLNPRLPVENQSSIRQMLGRYPDLKGHFWIATSGSTGVVKWTALSKQAVLSSAASVNKHLQSTQADHWITALPDFHVGGLGVWARAFLTGSNVTELSGKWDALTFYQEVLDKSCTLTALVPAQVYDLVSMSLSAPASLRAVIVGGGALHKPLYQKAMELGWPLLPSYGLTECASQVATAELKSARSIKMSALQILPHLELKIDDTGMICVKGGSLLTGYVVQTANGSHFVDPKLEGWFQTEDRGQIEGSELTVLGRVVSFVKIGGESVDLVRLERILDELKLQLSITYDAVLIAVPDERLGHVLHMAATQPASDLMIKFNSVVLPFERIRQMHILAEIPRSPLGKLLRPKLLEQIKQ